MSDQNTLDETQNKMVSSRGPVHSEPHEGHDGTNFEGTDAKTSMVVSSLAIIGGTLVFVFVLTLGIQRLLVEHNPRGPLPSAIAPERVVPPSPQLLVHPWDELPDLRAREDQILNSSGTDANGHVHVPIDRAIDAVVSRLTVSPGAPEGINTPGGEGRDFSKGLAEMPGVYHRPQISGEIKKSAR